MAERVVVVGSGAAGSVAAMVFAEAGWDVIVMERGPNLSRRLQAAAHSTSELGSDELKGLVRRFVYPDAIAEPRVFVHGVTGATCRGFVNALPSAVGGGTIHWDAKTPRFWDLDFAKHSMLGKVDGADIIDWPFEYGDLEAYYSEAERVLGVQGDASALPPCVRQHSPRASEYPMSPGPPQRSSLRIANAATRMGLRAYPMPAAINSAPYEGRPICNDCGRCCEYGCTIEARGSALNALEHACNAGAVLMPTSKVRRLVVRNNRVKTVQYADSSGRDHYMDADFVVLAASAVESTRLALLSGFPDPYGLIGTNIMFHSCSVAYGLFPEAVHDQRGRNISHAIDEFADPDFGAARLAARAYGLPYFRGGIVELGFSPVGPIEEGVIYSRFLPHARQEKPFGSVFKRMMRAGYLRRRTLGVMMHGEDLPQRDNRVTLDDSMRDWTGDPVPRIRYGPHRHETASHAFYLPLLAEVLRTAGATAVVAVPEMRQSAHASLGGPVPTDFHTMGGMRMAVSPHDGVVDESGLVRGLENVAAVDGSIFPSSGAHNPTLTIMAVALRIARRLVVTKG